MKGLVPAPQNPLSWQCRCYCSEPRAHGSSDACGELGGLGGLGVRGHLPPLPPFVCSGLMQTRFCSWEGA